MNNEPEWQNPEDTVYGAWERFAYAWLCLFQGVKAPIQRGFDWLNGHPNVQLVILVLLAVFLVLNFVLAHIHLS